jgi:hypothetical protein
LTIEDLLEKKRAEINDLQNKIMKVENFIDNLEKEVLLEREKNKIHNFHDARPTL